MIPAQITIAEKAVRFSWGMFYSFFVILILSILTMIFLLWLILYNVWEPRVDILFSVGAVIAASLGTLIASILDIRDNESILEELKNANI